MIDVKKLITGFLILATAAVCSGLIFSFVNLAPNTPVLAPSGITLTGSNDSANTDDANAFTSAEVNEVIAADAPDLASSTMMVSSTDPSNLTDVLATAFVNQVVSANPNGPSDTDADGNPALTAPDVNAIAESVAYTSSTQNLQIPDWDLEAEAIPITILATSSNSALATYAVALNAIFNSHFVNNTQIQNIVSNQTADADSNDLTYTASQIQSALQDAASLKVPTPAVAYQKSLLMDLVYEKNLVQLNNLAETDPVKASLLFQQEDYRFDLVEQNFLNEGQIFSNSTALQQTKKTGNIFISFLSETFGVPQANAQSPVQVVVTAAGSVQTDPVEIGDTQIATQQLSTLDLSSSAKDVGQSASLMSLISAIHVSNVGEKLEALLKNTLLQILKNTLISIIQREVLTWVQGSGAPRFITNWGTTLINAAQQSAINAINSQMSCGTYPAFIPQIKATLNALYKPGNSVCANQFAAALGANTFQQFYNNFANGGFVAFGASTLPSGNPYGSQFFSAQTVALTYNNQQAASQVKAQTSNGFTGDEVCADGSDPKNGSHVECESDTLQDYDNGSNSSCKTGFTPTVELNNNLCANGSQPQVTTPANVTSITFQSAEDATPKQVAAMNDITGVLNAVLNSLLTGVASAAVNEAGQIVNQGLTSLNASSITAAASTTVPTAIPLACNPILQTIPAAVGGSTLLATTSEGGSIIPTTAFPAILSATGGTLDVNDNQPTYYWTDTNGASSTGATFSDTFTTPGTYTVTLTDSASDTPAICTVTQQ